MSTIHSFPPICKPSARVLVLGSIPGKVSLLKQQYYAHGRNAFWKIMSQLLNFDVTLPYEQKVELLNESGIAIWDVLAMCTRSSSLDSDIVESSIVTNDFVTLLTDLPNLNAIYFNGAKAHQSWNRYVLPELSEYQRSIPALRLPSTSPAHASLNFERKLAEWSVVTQ